MNVNTSPLYAFGVSPAISKGLSLDAPEGANTALERVRSRSYGIKATAKSLQMKATLFRGRLDVVKRVLIYQTGYIIPELSLKDIVQFCLLQKTLTCPMPNDRGVT
jgi:hypothetical protein